MVPLAPMRVTPRLSACSSRLLRDSNVPQGSLVESFRSGVVVQFVSEGLERIRCVGAHNDHG